MSAIEDELGVITDQNTFKGNTRGAKGAKLGHKVPFKRVPRWKQQLNAYKMYAAKRKP